MEDNNLEIMIIAPLAPLYIGDEDLIGGINELIDLDKKLELDVSYNNHVSLNITYREKYKSIFDNAYGETEAVVFEIKIPYGYKHLKIENHQNGKISEASESEKRGFYESVVIGDFKLKVYHLLILYQIAKPGSIRLRKGEVYVNNKLIGDFFATNVYHRDAIDEIKKIQWPVYQNIPFLQVWDWFISNNFSFKRYSKIKVERALNSFTYLFDEFHVPGLQLMWALIGIEALYTSSKEGIADQIFNKTQILLGPITNFKKKLKQMYDFRSRLIHGDLDIPSRHYDFNDEDDEDDEAFQHKLYESTGLAIGILTATFQQLVLLDKRELNFRLIIE